MTKSSMTQTNTTQNDTTMSDALTTLNNTHRSDFDREWAIHKLSRSPTPQNTRRLVAALEDNEFGVRWAAAVALAELGQPALRPLLEALVTHPESVWLRQGAYHVLHYIADSAISRQTLPLRRALKGPGATYATAGVAAQMLAERGWLTSSDLTSADRPSTEPTN